MKKPSGAGLPPPIEQAQIWLTAFRSSCVPHAASAIGLKAGVSGTGGDLTEVRRNTGVRRRLKRLTAIQRRTSGREAPPKDQAIFVRSTMDESRRINRRVQKSYPPLRMMKPAQQHQRASGNIFSERRRRRSVPHCLHIAHPVSAA